MWELGTGKSDSATLPHVGTSTDEYSIAKNVHLPKLRKHVKQNTSTAVKLWLEGICVETAFCRTMESEKQFNEATSTCSNISQLCLLRTSCKYVLLLSFYSERERSEQGKCFKALNTFYPISSSVELQQRKTDQKYMSMGVGRVQGELRREQVMAAPRTLETLCLGNWHLPIVWNTWTFSRILYYFTKKRLWIIWTLEWLQSGDKTLKAILILKILVSLY